MATASVLRRLLEPTSLPPALIDEALADTHSLWLLGAPDEVVASELVLCHPALAADEVRAVVNPTTEEGHWRLTVVTADRSGLLSQTAGALAERSLTVVDAAVTVLAHAGLALQRMTVADLGGHFGSDADWDRLGLYLRSHLVDGEPVRVAFVPAGPVSVETQPQRVGRVLVRIEAPDRVGLLHAAATWFADNGCNVEHARAGSEGGRARDLFVVEGEVDTEALAAELGGGPVEAGVGVATLAGVGRAFVRSTVLLPWKVTAGVLRSVSRQVSGGHPRT